MSGRMTSISLLGTSTFIGSFADWGRVPAEEMIADHRKRAERIKADAEAILAAADSDFRIETYIGPCAQRKREVIQEGKKNQ